MTERVPYGSWKSPIGAELVAGESIHFGQIILDGDDIYWTEMRPAEAGRYVLVRYTPGEETEEITPPGYNVRTRVHEYGGGASLVVDGSVYFVNFADQLLYRQVAGGTPEPLTQPGYRYADFVYDSSRNRLICVREDHAIVEAGEAEEPVNSIVAVGLDAPGEDEILASGYDFYASPCINPAGTRLVWLAWNHPEMPWTSNELWQATVQPDGSLATPEMVAGGTGVSIFQPVWSPGGTLYFVSDRSGWWNIYSYQNGKRAAIAPMAAEFGRPQWAFGMSTYGFVADDQVVCAYSQQGRWYLANLNVATDVLTNVETPYTHFTNVQAGAGRVVLLTGSPQEAAAISHYDLADGSMTTLRRSAKKTVDARYLSMPRAIEFPTEDGLTAHAFYYPAHKPDYEAVEGELPPLLVMSHGGPTSATSTAFDLGVQFWTSRGIAVLDVNYGGSSGYGRAYRERLDGRWGIVDLDDCANAALYLVEQGEVDGTRLMIRGGSAGGYTTLAVLTFRDVFSAGASYFGVSDLALLAEETHKFESRYLDGLIGPYPERKDIYDARSPLHHTERLDCPIIFLQGLEDKIVLPNQAELMMDALRKKNVPVAYVPFEGEQHGFRQAKNIQCSLEAELYFYARIFGFALADEIEPVEIENLN